MNRSEKCHFTKQSASVQLILSQTESGYLEAAWLRLQLLTAVETQSRSVWLPGVTYGSKGKYTQNTSMEMLVCLFHEERWSMSRSQITGWLRCCCTWWYKTSHHVRLSTPAVPSFSVWKYSTLFSFYVFCIQSRSVWWPQRYRESSWFHNHDVCMYLFWVFRSL